MNRLPKSYLDTVSPLTTYSDLASDVFLQGRVLVPWNICTRKVYGKEHVLLKWEVGPLSILSLLIYGVCVLLCLVSSRSRYSLSVRQSWSKIHRFGS